MKNQVKKVENIMLMILGLSMTLIMFINALGRYILGDTFLWAEEVIRLLFAWAMFIGITDLFITGGHIGFDVVSNRNKTTRKVCAVVAYAVLIIIGWNLMVYGAGIISVIGKIPLPATKLPGAMFYIPGVIAGVVWIFIGIWGIVKTLRKQEKDRQEE